ncbi:hypothetical protein PPL_08343 [Heterostelium album PN500]|uniref:Uncharacterized protein n=1 Tax=Heterostelium pallidum (strain ATCC 26659 / Pp 5 / PN500) TaxID=670386 RepID=D3BHX5_HETP5|nr:hypothetical protein PPL_08343 [Heterostelium album PN500]EFA78875.1 hypothetical protein PPL_08343 [Heterostelium album PN500]|eukprot:XP_020430999.1 hypothetical protein PPL_08343 [Heterostelium album PN500]
MRTSTTILSVFFVAALLLACCSAEGPWILGPGQSQSGINTWVWPRMTTVGVKNANNTEGRIRMQAGLSPEEEDDVAPMSATTYERDFGAFPLTVTNIGFTELTVYTA